MSRAQKVFTVVAWLIVGGLDLTAYGVAMVTTDASTAAAAFFALLLGLALTMTLAHMTFDPK